MTQPPQDLTRILVIDDDPDHREIMRRLNAGTRVRIELPRA